MFISESLSISDPVLAFDRIIEEIEIKQYLNESCNSHTGRPRYNPVNMLKTILFGFMDTGYASLRELDDRCRVNLRYIYLMDDETPSYRSFGYFNRKLTERLIARNGYYSLLFTGLLLSSGLLPVPSLRGIKSKEGTMNSNIFLFSPIIRRAATARRASAEGRIVR